MSFLSYYDSLLTKEDVKLLENNNWLNDKLIGFCFEYFERNVFKKYASNIAFISPDVTQFIKMAEDEDIGIFLEPLNLTDKQYVFLAVNDNRDTETTGGSHWSLVVYNTRDNVIAHYDSYGENNTREAKSVADKLTKYLNKTQPGCDCGVYVICITEHLCHKLLARSTEKTLNEVITPQHVTQHRVYLHDLIQLLAKEQS